MKTSNDILKRAAFVAACMLPAISDAQVEIKWLGGVHGPPASSSLSPSFEQFRANRGQQMLNQIAGNGDGTVGSGYAASSLETMMYSKMVVTPSFESWHSVLAPETSQHGNARYDQGFYVYVNGGTFMPSEVTVNTTSEIWNGSAWVTGGGINVTTNLGTVHSARIRMSPGSDGVSGTIDDVPTSVQSGTIDSTGFVFIGTAVGLQAYGSGDNTQKMQNAIDYMAANKFRLRHTITVPTTLGTSTFVKLSGGSGNPDAPMIVLSKTAVEGQYTLDWTADGYGYILQRSEDLVDWENVSAVWYPDGLSVTYPIVTIDGKQKMFWRLARE